MDLTAGQPVRRPLVGMALSFAGGIILASSGLLTFQYAFPGSLLVLMFACLPVGYRSRSLLLFICIAGLGAMWFGLSDTDCSGRSVNRLQGQLPLSGISLVGKVSGEPRYYAFKSGDRGMWVFPFQVEGMGEGAWYRRRGTVDVRIMGALESDPCVRRGERVRLTGELQQRNYRGGNPVGLKVSDPADCSVLSEAGFSLVRWCSQWRESAASRLSPGMAGKPVQHAVLRSLVLGFRNEIPNDTYACFRRTGSLHIFAISGLHVGIIGLLMAAALKSIGIPRDRFGLVLVPLLLFYVVATGMKSSALRAATMAAVFLLAPLFRRKPDIPSSVAFAGMLLLALNPLEIRSAGFIYSFVVVAFIVMVYSVVPKQMLAEGWIRSYSRSLVITSLAASLASIPMTAYFFGRFSPVALLGNLVVVPLTFCIVLSGWLSILFPFASEVFNYASVAFINAMVWSVRGLDRLPGSSVAVEAPALGAMLLWYVSLIYLLTHAGRPRERILALLGVGGSVLWAVFL